MSVLSACSRRISDNTELGLSVKYYLLAQRNEKVCDNTVASARLFVEDERLLNVDQTRPLNAHHERVNYTSVMGDCVHWQPATAVITVQLFWFIYLVNKLSLY